MTAREVNVPRETLPGVYALLEPLPPRGIGWAVHHASCYLIDIEEYHAKMLADNVPGADKWIIAFYEC